MNLGGRLNVIFRECEVNLQKLAKIIFFSRWMQNILLNYK